VSRQRVALPILRDSRTSDPALADNEGVDLVVLALVRLLRERWAAEGATRELRRGLAVVGRGKA
jgi:hypothetical protein